MTTVHELDEATIRALLTELGHRLDDKDVAATLYVVGGAAVAITFDARRVTKDTDAVFDPAVDVRQEAAAMAEAHGLPSDWLSDAAAALVPDPAGDTDGIYFETPGLAVTVASPGHLLAMKMVAFRATDRADLALIFDALDIATPGQAADIATDVYGNHHALPDRVELELVAEAVLADRQRRRR